MCLLNLPRFQASSGHARSLRVGASVHETYYFSKTIYKKIENRNIDILEIRIVKIKFHPNGNTNEMLQTLALSGVEEL